MYFTNNCYFHIKMFLPKILFYQEDRSRVEIFREHSSRKRESIWGPFLNLLNRQDGFILNMTSRIIAKLACWSHELMEKTDLQFYLTWLKDQLKLSVSLPNLISNKIRY